MAKKGKKAKTEGKRNQGDELERLRAFATPFAIQVSLTMVALGEAVAIVIQNQDQAVLDQMRLVANETFDAADEALRDAVSKVQ